VDQWRPEPFLHVGGSFLESFARRQCFDVGMNKESASDHLRQHLKELIESRCWRGQRSYINSCRHIWAVKYLKVSLQLVQLAWWVVGLSCRQTQLKDFDFVQDLNHLWWDDNVRICELLVVDETMSWGLEKSSAGLLHSKKLKKNSADYKIFYLHFEFFYIKKHIKITNIFIFWKIRI
jgi:hypothetical protein